MQTLPIQRIQFMALKAFAMAMASNASPCLAFKVLAISLILSTHAVRAESSPSTSRTDSKKNVSLYLYMYITTNLPFNILASNCFYMIIVVLCCVCVYG